MSTKAEQREYRERRRTAHQRALASLHQSPETADGLKMWRALRPCIDWEKAADELKQDYTIVTYQGADYLVRS